MREATSLPSRDASSLHRSALSPLLASPWNDRSETGLSIQHPCGCSETGEPDSASRHLWLSPHTLQRARDPALDPDRR